MMQALMRFVTSLGLVLWVCSLAHSAQDWEAEYTKVCGYDKFCTFLKDQNGKWIDPSDISVVALVANRAEILKAAKLYDIRPEAIAGVLSADSTLTPAYEDELLDYIKSKYNKNPHSQRTPNAPLGIIHLDTALAVEELAAKTEHRSPRTESEVSDLLKTPAGTIAYAAAILRNATDVYGKYGLGKPGIGISQDIDIQATLYNLGGAEKRAKNATPGTQPRHNFFGLYVARNETILKKIVDPSVPLSDLIAMPDKLQCQALTVAKTTEFQAFQKEALESEKALNSKDLQNEFQALWNSYHKVFGSTPPSLEKKEDGARVKTLFDEFKGKEVFLKNLCPSSAKLAVFENDSDLLYACSRDAQTLSPLAYIRIPKGLDDKAFEKKSSFLRACIFKPTPIGSASVNIQSCTTDHSNTGPISSVIFRNEKDYILGASGKPENYVESEVPAACTLDLTKTQAQGVSDRNSPALSSPSTGQPPAEKDRHSDPKGSIAF